MLLFLGPEGKEACLDKKKTHLDFCQSANLISSYWDEEFRVKYSYSQQTPGINSQFQNNPSLEGSCTYKLELVYNLKFKATHTMCIDYTKANSLGNYGHVWKQLTFNIIVKRNEYVNQSKILSCG